uniref:Sulfotransferase n=1 Tax=Romanomermis culicivorax TaxID=13658 RepID=A0A915K088_ROMCU
MTYGKFLEIYKEFTNYFIFPTFAQARVYYYQWGNFPFFILLNIFRLIFACVQFFTWRLWGIKGHLDRMKSLENSEPSTDFLSLKSAQVLQVIASCKPTPFDKVRPSFYLTFHSHFVEPGYVLADNVMLAEVSPEKVVFVEMRRPIDQYTVKNSVFLYITLVKEAVRLIKMPLKVFHQLADRMRQTWGKNNDWKHIMFLFNSGRCGSTVVARIVEEAGEENFLVLSEPSVFMDFVWFKRQLSEDFFKQTLRSTLILFLKPMCGKKRLFVKLPYFVGCIAEEFYAFWPQAQYVYLHRDPLRVVLAHERAFGASPICKLLSLTVRFNLWPLAGKVIGFHRYEHVEAAVNKYLKPTMFEVCLIVWSDSYRRYLEQASCFPYAEMVYDHLLENPWEFCQKLLSLADLPENRLKNALKALDKDSQEESVLSRNTLQKIPMTSYSLGLQQRCDQFCDELGMPRLDWDQWKKQMIKKSGKSAMVKSANDNFVLESKLMYKPVPLQCLVSDYS